MIAVLHGWSHNNWSQRFTGVGFIFAFGIAAAWGLHILFRR